jgi:hypothetical protein
MGHHYHYTHRWLKKINNSARFLQRVEMLLTLGGCPWGRARQAKYGVPPDQPLPGDPDTSSPPDVAASHNSLHQRS